MGGLWDFLFGAEDNSADYINQATAAQQAGTDKAIAAEKEMFNKALKEQRAGQAAGIISEMGLAQAGDTAQRQALTASDIQSLPYRMAALSALQSLPVLQAMTGVTPYAVQKSIQDFNWLGNAPNFNAIGEKAIALQDSLANRMTANEAATASRQQNATAQQEPVQQTPVQPAQYPGQYTPSGGTATPLSPLTGNPVQPVDNFQPGAYQSPNGITVYLDSPEMVAQFEKIAGQPFSSAKLVDSTPRAELQNRMSQVNAQMKAPPAQSASNPGEAPVKEAFESAQDYRNRLASYNSALTAYQNANGAQPVAQSQPNIIFPEANIKVPPGATEQQVQQLIPQGPQTKEQYDSLTKQGIVPQSAYPQEMRGEVPVGTAGMSGTINTLETTTPQYNFQDSPLYQWQKQEAEKNMGRALRARGLYGSETGAKIAVDEQNALAAQEADKQYARVLNLVNLGMGGGANAGVQTANAGTQMGQTYQNMGSSLGNSLQQGASTRSSMYNNLGGNMASAYSGLGAGQAAAYNALAQKPQQPGFLQSIASPLAMYFGMKGK